MTLFVKNCSPPCTVSGLGSMAPEFSVQTRTRWPNRYLPRVFLSVTSHSKPNTHPHCTMQCTAVAGYADSALPHLIWHGSRAVGLMAIGRWVLLRGTSQRAPCSCARLAVYAKTCTTPTRGLKKDSFTLPTHILHPNSMR